LSDDERRTAAMLLADGGHPGDAGLGVPAVRRLARRRRVPPLPLRVADRLRLDRGLAERSLATAAAARRAALGEAAAGPPRVLLRVDEFPNGAAWEDRGIYGTESFRRFHDILMDAGCDYMIAVLPRVSRSFLDPADGDDRPLNDAEREMVAQLARDGAELAVHGFNHRTRDARPRHHSELIGLSPDELEARLDESDRVLRELGVEPRSFVPPFNRFSASQFPALARRYEIVCAGPETVMQMGFQPTPQAREGTIYVPAYAPLYDRAGPVRAEVERLIEQDAGVWAPVVLHWSWEAEDDGFAELERLARILGPLTVPWQDLVDAAALDGPAGTAGA
jgi:peptidoglycan/xylan/chitin deacetylase (PgdA/CDA1 family)